MLAHATGIKIKHRYIVECIIIILPNHSNFEDQKVWSYQQHIKFSSGATMEWQKLRSAAS